MVPASCQPSGARNFKLSSRFLGNLRALGLGFDIWTVQPSLQIVYLATRVFFFYGFVIIWAVSRRNGCAGVISPVCTVLWASIRVRHLTVAHFRIFAVRHSCLRLLHFTIWHFLHWSLSRKLRSCLSQILWKFHCLIIDFCEPELAGPQSVINSPSFM